MHTTSMTPEIFDINLQKKRASRGIFGFSGYIDFKVETDTDKAVVELNVYYSANGFTYTRSPIHIGPSSMTKVLNKEYKLYIEDTFVDCSTNAMNDYHFVSPLSARYMNCTNCQFKTNNIPTSLRLGYYKLILLVYDKPNINCTFLIKLEID